MYLQTDIHSDGGRTITKKTHFLLHWYFDSVSGNGWNILCIHQILEKRLNKHFPISTSFCTSWLNVVIDNSADWDAMPLLSCPHLSEMTSELTGRYKMAAQLSMCNIIPPSCFETSGIYRKLLHSTKWIRHRYSTYIFNYNAHENNSNA